MSKLAVFSKYFGYDVGGAERSVLELMKAEESRGHQIVALVNSNPKNYGAVERRLPLPNTWEVREFQLPVDLVRFRFVEYCVNRRSLRKLAANLTDIDMLYAYGNLAPAVINVFPGKTVYLVRDEYGLGWNVNYHKGARAIAQSLYHASEAPLRALWRRDLVHAINSSRLIANSCFIANELRKLAPEGSIDIIHPHVDANALIADFKMALSKAGVKQGVVVIGDNPLKGGDIVRRVAAHLPDVLFYVFDRKYSSPWSQNNIHYMPWQTPDMVYRHARIVMVPSRWAEAFSRTVLEAQILKIPVVASSRGGIPEAIDDPTMLVDDIEDVSAWVHRIEHTLQSARTK